MTYREALELGKHKQLTVDGALDHDSELEFGVEDGYNSSTFYLSVADLLELRDHIDAVLADARLRKHKEDLEKEEQ
jgi:hypothetical protein